MAPASSPAIRSSSSPRAVRTITGRAGRIDLQAAKDLGPGQAGKHEIEHHQLDLGIECPLEPGFAVER